MRLSIAVLLALVLAAVGAHFMMDETGYVLVNYRGTRFETSLFGAVLLLLSAYLIVRILIRLWRAPFQFGEAVGKQRVDRAKRKMNEALIEMAEGNWAKSEKLLSQGAKSSDMPLLNYLNAARAAQEQGAHERRDNWLKLAYEQSKDAGNAVLLTQAELQIDHEQYEMALATLRQLNEGAPGHRKGLVLLAAIYERLEDWAALHDLLPQLTRKKAMPAAELDALKRRTYGARLREAGRSGDQEALTAAWTGTPAPLQKTPDILHAYVSALTDASQSAAAEKTLRKALKDTWTPELVIDYGRLEGPDPGKQLSVAEGWLKNHGNDAPLLLTAARLAMRNELWGKARSYLESSIALLPRVESYHLYGELLEKMGETEGAAVAFRNGLTLATGASPAPALPEAKPDADS
ncbi:MAG: heme biosynthesis HemY N-terminal domain-containing protein [Pseudomonadota bacterium]